MLFRELCSAGSDPVKINSTGQVVGSWLLCPHAGDADDAGTWAATIPRGHFVGITKRSPLFGADEAFLRALSVAPSCFSHAACAGALQPWACQESAQSGGGDGHLPISSAVMGTHKGLGKPGRGETSVRRPREVREGLLGEGGSIPIPAEKKKGEEGPGGWP